METAKIAPLAVFLASDEAKDVTGQIFAVRANEIFLMSQSRPLRSVHRREGWTPDSIRTPGNTGPARTLLSARPLAGRVLLGSALKRVLLTDTIAPAGEEALRREVEVVRAPDSDVATLRTWARDVDGVLTRSKLPDDLFEAAPRVRGVVVHGTGTDLVPVAAATAHGVMVANLPGINAHSVAEYCAMAMLLLARNALSIIHSLKNETWDEARAPRRRRPGDRRHDARHRRRRARSAAAWRRSRATASA